MDSERDSRYFSRQELESMRFRHLGRNVLISRTTRIYDPEYVAIGDHSIVDDFCVLSGNLQVGRNVHIAHGCRVIAGREGVLMDDFSGLAFGVTIFAQSDDYTGEALTNPTVPMQYRRIARARVELGRHVIIGAGTVVFPGVMLAEGSSVGACSMVTRSTEAWAVYVGVPAKKVRERSRRMLQLEKEYLQQEGSDDAVPAGSVVGPGA
ncbi:MAG TPA: acyltransferase [Candidatus Accumulibacter phosphatis]|nr:O-acetyltransferase [Accumulibacter sp.]HCN67468.1 O-acetyltransferase [Accumulibacter sp.]HCV13931.1 O-acetyltransferase [Accumulibacter sp.]HRL76435.1 acyltransferase [Candidatus Accumulibacter phosphatis]HRQ94420.1 acyltransferase [Candidatus Accumulibacter phosphatis]